MEQENIWERFQKLPPQRQQEVVDFISFLSHESGKKTTRLKKPSKLTDDPFFGCWKDREDMQNSTEWVRNLRKREWRS